jgi:hypothetical protein
MNPAETTLTGSYDLLTVALSPEGAARNSAAHPTARRYASAHRA